MPTVRYRITSANPATHRYDIEVSLPPDFHELIFPSWAPGSYLMREFARNVRDLQAFAPDGSPIEVIRVSRNEWHLATTGPATLKYQVYAREKSVRTPFLDETLSFFVPTNLLPFAHKHRNAEFVLEVQVPEGHTGVCTLGEPVTGPATAVWTCNDIDTLYDTPVSVGPFEHTSFVIDGIAHHHYIEPGHNGDLERINTDLEKICREAGRLMGGFPYPHYTFVTLLTRDGHGGLEHKDSSILLKPRRGFGTPVGYEEFLTLAAHEHFHAWNVKRIRPEVLSAPFAYERENYTPDLWWLEGGTVYYEERIAYRAGIVSKERHLERISDLIKRLARTHGRKHQSLEESSFDTWIKLYRPSEDSANSTISYYLKGAVVALALDLEILARTGGKASIDTVLCALWQRYGALDRPYPPGEIQRIIVEIAGESIAPWLDHHLRTPQEIELDQALAHLGVEVQAASPAPGSWLGIEHSGDRVSQVREDGPAYGVLSVGDELLAINGERVRSAELSELLKETQPGTSWTFLLARDGRILERTLVTGALPRTDLKLQLIDTPTEAQINLRRIWL